jgi:predicted 3-demethylubiquinone-9 3-methyltransferase (glyoxalase superfamily)
MLGELMSHPEKGQRVMQAFMKMKKFDIATLLNA